jgi:hypothetical protein
MKSRIHLLHLFLQVECSLLVTFLGLQEELSSRHDVENIMIQNAANLKAIFILVTSE